MFWSIRKACCCTASSPPPTFRIATAVSRCRRPWFGCGKLFADSAYQGPVFHRALAGILPDLETEIVKRSDRVKGFVVQPRRWGWSNAPSPVAQRLLQLAKDWENLTAALAFIKPRPFAHAPKTLLILPKSPDGL